MEEENLEIIDRGLLSEANGDESEIIVIKERKNRTGVLRQTTKTKPARDVSAKVLDYLGTVKVTTSFKTSNPKAWLMQSILNELGYTLKPDGFFGQLTEKEVKKFQADHGLVDDGIVGRATWSELIYQGKRRITNSTISEQDFKDAAADLGVEVAVVKAVTEVEAGGRGYVFSNHPTILFESHVFWKELKKRGVTPSKYKDKDILNQTWAQGKAYYKGGVAEHARLQKARLINTDAANASASWGLFQIMGNNYAVCGCKSVGVFVKRMCKSEGEQLKLFVAFIKNNHLDGYLQKKQWAKFAARYNGAGYKENSYDTKLEKAYNKYKKQ